MVQELDSTYDNNMSVMLGSMFAQNFYQRFLHYDGLVNITLFVNQNAMSSVYMGDEDLPEGDSPFGINPMTLTAVKDKSVAVFSASINGTTVDSAKYYLDFTSTRSVVWTTDCKRSAFTGFGSGPCSTAPVNAKMHYDSTEQ